MSEAETSAQTIPTNNEGMPSKGGVYEVFITFLKLGLTSFGGPVAHIGYFRKTLVEKKAWLNEDKFSQLLAMCQFLPGPASSQLGFVLGLLRAGWLGALAAFFAFTLPSVLLLFGFIALLPYLSSEVYVAVIHGLKLVACVVVAEAVLAMSKNLCPDLPRRFIALITCFVLVFLSTSGAQVFMIAAGGIAGAFWCKNKYSEHSDIIKVHYSKRLGGALLGVFILLLVSLPLLSHQGGLYNLASAFYQAGALVFGGGHVVLPLLETSIVDAGLVTQANFLAGYGASQAIPGPMFSFAAYLGALISLPYSSLFLGIFALFFMFVPGFLLVSGVLPFWQTLSQYHKASNIIAGVNASVVGVLVAALYDPIFTSGIKSFFDLSIVFIALIVSVKYKLSPLLLVLGCVLTSLWVLWW